MKCLRCPVFEHPLAVSVLTGPKHCWSMHGSTFILSFHKSEIDWLGKLIENLLQPIQMQFSKKKKPKKTCNQNIIVVSKTK